MLTYADEVLRELQRARSDKMERMLTYADVC
jgi:hypothetical protein